MTTVVQQDYDGEFRPAPVPADFLITVRSVDDDSIIKLRASDLAESLKAALTGCEPIKVARLNAIEEQLARFARVVESEHYTAEDVAAIDEKVTSLGVMVSNLTARMNDLGAGPRSAGGNLEQENARLRKMLAAAI